MKEYVIHHVPDGFADSDAARGSCLENAPEAHIDEVLWLPDAGIRAKAQVLYDETALYVRLAAAEEHIRAEHTGPYGMPCEDSCLEFFFAPMMASEHSAAPADASAPSAPENAPACADTRYFNIECNPNGSIFLGIGHGPGELYRIVTESPERAPIQPKTARMPGGWMCEYKVPFDFIRFFFPDFNPKKGSAMRGNFYKCGDLTRQEHYMAWNPVDLPAPCFHCPGHFGLLTFGD